MKKILLTITLLGMLTEPALAQGLISGPDEAQRPIANRLELERARLFHEGLNSTKAKTVYGSIVWQLADKYESLNQWQDALAAHNTLQDLKLPPNAIAECTECQMRATDDVIALDVRRLISKVSSVESIEHKHFDHTKRLPEPTLGSKEQRAYDLAVKTTPLPKGHAVTLEEMLKPQ